MKSENEELGGERPSIRSLSDYVKEKEAEALRIKAGTEREAQERRIVEWENKTRLYLERTALLRAYLLDLSKSAEMVLERYHAREVLEEIRSNLWKGGAIEVIQPPIYTAIVSKPNPNMTAFDLVDQYGNKKSVVHLEELNDMESLRKHIPNIEGIGLILRQVFVAQRVVTESDRYWVPNPMAYNGKMGYYVVSFGPDGGYISRQTERIIPE